MCTSPYSSCHLACFCDLANKDVEQHFQSVMHNATFGKRARLICNLRNDRILRYAELRGFKSGGIVGLLSFWCVLHVIGEISCINALSIHVVFFLGRSVRCQTRGSRLWEKGRSGWGYACQRWQLCPSSPLLRPPPPSGCHSLHEYTHTHTRRYNCQVPRQPAHRPVPRMLYCL